MKNSRKTSGKNLEPQKLRVVIADSHALVRAGIRALIDALEDFECVGEVGDGQRLLETVAAAHPDIVVTELVLPTVNGMDAVAHIRRHYPEVGILALSADTQPHTVRAALKAGVFGFLAKDAEKVELQLALRATHRREGYFSPKVSRQVLEVRRIQHNDDRPSLTPRQRQLMQMLARGHSTRQIATIMGVGIKTVETHRMRVMQTLRIGNASALVHYAIRQGFDGRA